MNRQASIRHKNRALIRANIKTIRCYLELTHPEFATMTGIGKKRCAELETRFLPTQMEIEAIAKAAEINPNHIINHRIHTILDIS